MTYSTKYITGILTLVVGCQLLQCCPTSLDVSQYCISTKYLANTFDLESVHLIGVLARLVIIGGIASGHRLASTKHERVCERPSGGMKREKETTSGFVLRMFSCRARKKSSVSRRRTLLLRVWW